MVPAADGRLRLVAGEHTLVASAPGHQDARQVIDLCGGQVLDVTLAAQPASTGAPAAALAPDATSSGDGDGVLSKWRFWTAGGYLHCALREDGKLRCGGEDYDGSVTGPNADQGLFVQVDTGYLHTCAVRQDHGLPTPLTDDGAVAGAAPVFPMRSRPWCVPRSYSGAAMSTCSIPAVHVESSACLFEPALPSMS